MAGYSGTFGRFEFNRAPTPSPPPSSCYSHELEAPSCRPADNGDADSFETAAANDDSKNITVLFDQCLDRLNAGYDCRQALRQQATEADELVDELNWQLFTQDCSLRDIPSPAVHNDLPITPPHYSPAQHLQQFTPVPGPQLFAHDAAAEEQRQRQRQTLLARRDAARARSQDLWRMLRAATAEVEDHLKIFWVLLAERQRRAPPPPRPRREPPAREIVPAPARSRLEHVRALLAESTFGELEEVRGALEDLLPLHLSPRTTATGSQQQQQQQQYEALPLRNGASPESRSPLARGGEGAGKMPPRPQTPHPQFRSELPLKSPARARRRGIGGGKDGESDSPTIPQGSHPWI